MCERALAERTGTQPGFIFEALDKLEQDGLIRREPGVGDRKGIVVSLTDDGNRLDGERGARMAEMFSPLEEVGLFDREAVRCLEPAGQGTRDGKLMVF